MLFNVHRQLTMFGIQVWQPGLSFINILRAAFALVDPKSVKNTVKSSVSVFLRFWDLRA